MEKFLIVTGGVGIICVLASLVGMGATAASERHWGTALACLAAFAMIVAMTLAGIEYADSFWEGK